MSKVMDFFKKTSNDELEDLDSGYDNDYYKGAYVEEDHGDRDDRGGDPDSRGRRDRNDSYDRRGRQRADSSYSDGADDGGYYAGRSDRTGDGDGLYMPNSRDDRRPDRRDDRQDDRRGNRRTEERADSRPARRSTTYEEPEYDSRTSRRYAEEEEQPYIPPQRRPVVVAEPDPEPAGADTLYFVPTSDKDSREDMVDGMRDGHVVVVSVVKLEVPEVIRLSDYIQGAVYALEGDLFRLDRTTVVMVPKGVEVDPDTLDIPEEDADDIDEEEEEDDGDGYGEDDDSDGDGDSDEQEEDF